MRDEEGFLYFVGRKDEMIKTSGYRVSPAEVEEHGAALDGAALQAELRNRLPLYMLPKDVVVRPEIAPSPNGKFDRSLLRAEFTR